MNNFLMKSIFFHSIAQTIREWGWQKELAEMDDCGDQYYFVHTSAGRSFHMGKSGVPSLEISYRKYSRIIR
jgi:hypothetical protein